MNERAKPTDPDTPDHEESPPLVVVTSVMASQYSVVSDRQVRALGLSLKRQQTMIRNGLWRRQWSGVIADAAVEPTWHQRAMAATLLPGSSAVLDGAAAARLHALDGFDAVERLIVVTSNRGRVSAPAEVTVNRSRVLEPEDTVMVGPIRATNVAVTLIHLCLYGLSNRGRAFDSALRLGHEPADLRDVFDRWRRKGMHGPVEAIELLVERTGTRLPRSWFQRLASALLSSGGIETDDELPIYDEHGQRVAELDLAVVGWKVGVECQSWLWHGSPAAQRRDVERKRTLRRLGWEIIELWWSDLDHSERAFADIVAAVERARRLGAYR